MKKYNLSKIMKRAWEIVKKASFGISEALKKAWKEAKMGGTKMTGTEKQINFANDLIKKNERAVRCTDRRLQSRISGKCKHVGVLQRWIQQNPFRI